MKKLLKTLLIICLHLPVFAQYTMDKQVSFVYIKGTSTLHDWTVTVENMDGKLNASVQEKHILSIDSAHVTIPSLSLKSGKEIMDVNMHKALKTEQYKNIKFNLKQHIVHNGEITVAGEITIAGVSKEINTKVMQEGLGEHIKINGEVQLKMTDFNVKPPEFLLGMFTTGDEITIQFYFMFCDENYKYKN